MQTTKNVMGRDIVDFHEKEKICCICYYVLKYETEGEYMELDKRKYRNKIRGCLIGGAVGDALGYPVEFLTYRKILKKYPTKGIREYELDFNSGTALISDDTQMTLFTAAGILLGQTEDGREGFTNQVRMSVWKSYQEWLETQGHVYGKPQKSYTWLADIPELNQKRAPGLTCIRAIKQGNPGSIHQPINHSKGCGGIMRVAPLGLYYAADDPEERKDVDRAAAEIAALTHTHPLGYIPAAILTHIISAEIYGGAVYGNSLEDIVMEAIEVVPDLFEEKEYNNKLQLLLKKAVDLSQNTYPDEENIRNLGEGWTAEETLAIAVYCSLRYQESFSEGIIASVNHKGDSDSTGAVTGNILGAVCGYEEIEEKWKSNLELKELILETADRLCGE